VIQRFLFDRIDAKTTGASIADQLDFIVETLAHVAQPSLAFSQVAVSRTQITLQPAVIQSVPVPRRHYRFLHISISTSSSSAAAVNRISSRLTRSRSTLTPDNRDTNKTRPVKEGGCFPALI
jgi:hypothetical protein